MVSALLRRGVKVGYQKPVGQQTVPIMSEGDELQVDRDVDIFKYVWPELIGERLSQTLVVSLGTHTPQSPPTLYGIVRA
jgi:hypothetical protein